MNKIKIGYKNYDIIETVPIHVLKACSNDCYGEILFDENKIYINNNFDDDTMKTALIHEVLHGISDMYDVELTEEQVTMLAKGIYITLKDNDLNFNRQLEFLNI